MLAEQHGVAGERDCDAGAELDLRGVLGREHQREERIVAGLGRPYAGEPERLGLACLFGHPMQIGPDPPVDLHGRNLTTHPLGTVRSGRPVRFIPGSWDSR